MSAPDLRGRALAAGLTTLLAPLVLALAALLRLSHSAPQIFYRARGLGASGRVEHLTIFDLSHLRGRLGRHLGDLLSRSGLEAMPMVCNVLAGAASWDTVHRQAHRLHRQRRFERLLEQRDKAIHEGSFDDNRQAREARVDAIDEELWQILHGKEPMPERDQLQATMHMRGVDEVEAAIKPSQRTAWADISEPLTFNQALRLQWGMRYSQQKSVASICSTLTDEDQQAGDDFYNEILPVPLRGGGLRLEIRRRTNAGRSGLRFRHYGRVRVAHRRTGSRQRASRGAAPRTRGSRRRSTAGKSSSDDPGGEGGSGDLGHRAPLSGKHQLRKVAA